VPVGPLSSRFSFLFFFLAERSSRAQLRSFSSAVSGRFYSRVFFFASPFPFLNMQRELSPLGLSLSSLLWPSGLFFALAGCFCRQRFFPNEVVGAPRAFPVPLFFVSYRFSPSSSLTTRFRQSRGLPLSAFPVTLFFLCAVPFCKRCALEEGKRIS